MSREIKFRAWDLDLKQMIYFDISDTIALARLKIMQYIGLKDKNDKEIYEGDIVVQNCYLWFDDGKPNYRGTVEMIYQQWQVVAHCVNPNKQGISDGMNESINPIGWEEKSDWEVIGNIFENPELL